MLKILVWIINFSEKHGPSILRLKCFQIFKFKSLELKNKEV